jgi:uncharacterized protein YndB with AHSA1/START domain
MDDMINLPPIEVNTYIAVPPQRVYDALTTPSVWDAWFTQGMELDPRAGGSILFRWIDAMVDRYTTTAGGPVLEAEPPRRFVFQWTPGDSTTTIEFELERLGPGTRLSVKESGHRLTQKDVEALADCAAGWGEALTLLKFYLEHGTTYGEVPHQDPVP